MLACSSGLDMGWPWSLELEVWTYPSTLWSRNGELVSCCDVSIINEEMSACKRKCKCQRSARRQRHVRGAAKLESHEL